MMWGIFKIYLNERHISSLDSKQEAIFIFPAKDSTLIKDQENKNIEPLVLDFIKYHIGIFIS